MKTLLQIINLLTYIERHLPFRSIILCALCLSIVNTSCNYDDIKKNNNNSEAIHINVYTVPTSFNQAVASESYITQIKALVYVYDGTNYVFNYLAEVKNIYHGNAGYTNFSLNLFGEVRPVKITIIANADDAVAQANLLFGETENNINQRINKIFTSNGITENIPMWAEFIFDNGISSSLNDTLFGTKALRTLARVDVNASNVASNFEMTNIQAYRVNNKIQLIPNSFTTDPLKVNTPSIPTSSIQNINTQAIPTSQNISTSQLYIPESTAPGPNNQITGATCVIIGGRYNGSLDTTYYRLDFDPPTTSYPTGQILRNHQYTFNITKVNGPGWPTPDDAANNASSHLLTSTIDWIDNYININIGGSNYFFIYTKHIKLIGDTPSEVVIPIQTDISNCTLFWSDALGNPTSEDKSTDIINDYFAASINATQVDIRSLQRNNAGNAVREQYFTIAAGRLRVPIKIEQDESLCTILTQVNPVGSVSRTGNINTVLTALEVEPVFEGGTINTPQYQWYRNTLFNTTSGTIINGAVNSRFSAPTNAAGTLFYYCVVTNSCNGEEMVSPIFTVTINCPAPSPLGLAGTQTPSGNVASGTSVTMTVTPPTLAGGSSLGYRWFQNNTLIQGANTNTLTRAITANTTFRCEAFNTICSSSIASRTFTVTLTPNLEWATRNVGAFRTFTTNIQDFGGFFQWDRTTSFPADGSQNTPAGWNNILSAALNWQAVNDPCPTGWRLPTNDDWAIFRTMYPARSFRTTGNLASPGNGTWFAPTQAQADAATFANPGLAIFLPSGGWRNNTGQHAFGANNAEFGFYWSSNRTATGFRIFQLGSGTGIIYAVSEPSAYSVRCVRNR